MWNTAKRILKKVPFLYLIFALLSNILPFCRTVPISDETKARLNEVNFNGSAEYGPDRVTLLETPDEALEARLALLQSAQSTIDLTCYKVVSGDSADAVLGELLLAADRGVQVRILLDGRVGMTDQAMKKRLDLLNSHPNISYRRYNPVHLLRPWEWHSILHDKFIVVDDTWLLLGGRNIGDRYYAPDGYEGAVTNDRDVLVLRQNPQEQADGSVLHQAATYMDRLWESEHTVGVAEKDPRKMERERQDLLSAMDQFEQRNPRFYTQTIEDYGSRTVPTKKITLITNPIHTGKKEPEIAYQMSRIAMEANDRLIVQTPYATANSDLLNTMEAVCERVPGSVMLTNSLASSPNYPAFSNYYSQRKAFVKTGMQIYEYQSSDSIHGKSMLVDDHISVVGSFNLDDRSMYIDTETMLVIDSEEFTQILSDAMEDIRSQSLLVDDTGKDYAAQQQVAAVVPRRSKEVITALVALFSCLFQFLV